jgi:hypothetical protein
VSEPSLDHDDVSLPRAFARCSETDRFATLLLVSIGAFVKCTRPSSGIAAATARVEKAVPHTRSVDRKRHRRFTDRPGSTLGSRMQPYREGCAPWQLFVLSRSPGGVGALVAGEEAVDDAGAVVVVDDAEPCHPCEQQRSGELGRGELNV